MTSRLLSRAKTRTSTSFSSRLGLIQITLAAVLWGTSGVTAQLVHRATGMGPLDISFWRLAISAAAMLLIALPQLRSVVRAARRSPLGLAAAGIGLAAYQGLYFVSVTTVGVNVATMVSLGTAPVVAVIWEAVSGRRWPTVRQLVIITVAVAGLVLIAGGQGHTSAGPNPTLGVLAALGSGLIYGGSAILGRHLAQHTSAIAMTTLTSIVGALALAPFALLSGPAAAPTDDTPTWIAYLGLAYVGVVATAVAYILFNRGLHGTDSSSAAVLTLIEPLTAAVLAVTILSEPLGWATLVGGGLLLGAIALLYLSPGTRKTAGGAPSGAPPAAATNS